MNKKTLGLAYKAKKVILGTDLVINGMRKKEVFLVLLASDASDNTKKKLSDKAKTYDIKLSQEFSFKEISDILGKKVIKVVGITDRGFAKLLSE